MLASNGATQTVGYRFRRRSGEAFDGRRQPLSLEELGLSVLVNGMREMLRLTLGPTIRIEIALGQVGYRQSFPAERGRQSGSTLTMR